MTCYTLRGGFQDAIYNTVLCSIMLYSTIAYNTKLCGAVLYTKPAKVFARGERESRMMVSKNRAESCPYFALPSVRSARDSAPGRQARLSAAN